MRGHSLAGRPLTSVGRWCAPAAACGALFTNPGLLQLLTGVHTKLRGEQNLARQVQHAQYIGGRTQYKA